MGPSQDEGFGKSQIVTPQVWKDQTFTAVANTLSSISARHPVILFIDDLHWADSASLALIHYLGLTVNSAKVLVLATFRSEQLVADAEGRPNPLVETLRLMRREDLIKEINIANLDQTCVSELAENMLGGDVQQELAQKLTEESQGNPLFVVESLRMLFERNNLMLERDQWCLASDAIDIPPKIKDIILQRLSALLLNQRNVLDAASVIGEKFNAELLASVLGQDSIDVIKILDAIAKETSLVGCEGNLYRFDHGRTRDTIYDDISPALKRGYHARVAEKLESMSKNGKLPFSDLAFHSAHAGNEEKAVKYALAAGQDALAKWSNTEAIKHFTYVVQTVGEIAKHAQEKAIALEGLGDAYFASDNFSQATSVFEQFGDVQTGAAKLRALRKAIAASTYQGELAKPQLLIHRAEDIMAADDLEAARVLFKKGLLLMNSDWMKGYELMTQALKFFEKEYALSDAADVLVWTGYTSATIGELEKGVSDVLRSVALYEELGNYRSQMEAYAYAGGVFQCCTLIEEANRMVAKVIEINGQYKIEDYVRMIPALVWWSLGLMGTDISSAISKTLKALEYCEKTDSNLYKGAVYETLIVEHAFVGDNTGVDEFFGKLMSLPQYILKNPVSQSFIGPVMGVYYAAKNDFEESNKSFKNFLAATPNPYELLGRQLYAWALSKQYRLEEAKTQLEEAQKIIETARRRFSHVNIQANLMTLTKPDVNQTFNLRLDLVNVSKSQGLIVKVENLLVPGLKIVDVSPNCIIHDDQIEFKDNRISSFEVKTIKLTVKATNPEEFHLNPTVTYLDDLGETKTSTTRPFTITVQPAKPKYEILPGRITTGFSELDALLFGGIPEKCAIVLVSPSIDEKELLIKRFLEAGASAGETTFYVTAEAANTKALAEKYPSNFYLFICNPQADAMVQSLPNVFKLKGIENLTDIDIALTKAFRTLIPSDAGSKRICIEIVSDVLLQHHAVTLDDG